MVQPQNLSFFLIFLVVLRGTAAPVLFQWLVSRDVSTGAPFSNGTIIPISTSLLLVSVLIHSTRAANPTNNPAGLFFMRSPLAAPYIVVSSIRPLSSPNIGRSSSYKKALFVQQSLVKKDLLDSIVPRKRCLKIVGRGPCFLLSVLGRLALFHFITIKFMGDFSYLESFRGVLCSFPFRTFFFHRYNSRDTYDRHKQILFLFHKRRRNIISSLRNNFITWRCFLVYCGPHESAEEGRRAGLLRSAERRPSRLIHVMKISHGGVCIFIMGVILSNARKILQFTGKTPLGSELHIGGSVRSTSRGIDQLHGPTFHPICGNLIIYNTKNKSLFFTKLMSDRSCCRRGLIPQQWPTDGVVVPARSGMGSRIIQQASSKKRISFADPAATSGKSNIIVVSKKLTMFPEKRFYFSDQETSITKVAIDTNPFTDLYALIGTGSFETGWYTTVIKLPSIFRIWIGFIMASLGGLLSPFRKLTLYQQRLDWD
uniref:cytochrome c biogenesis factor C n=1 Tax=Pellia epiphylla TaxID=40340 RepID=UPI00257AA499|nr:cytochrome c biogenesis factor C [Pellia epiphylla]WIA66734.1 cytochrome c biogenesis factor C [Pellia epiphylla var. borealis]WIA66693.1 cytochrome c biogenesis factor C [Pellia epiphylla]WIA66775.1 cytochrome c biogenesis factor C [Pellia epiphylla var. borealis]WIA66816.1 cytochrome c biogenesis factor C [Pellia epiphylla]WIA66857.1 cytochrome c biogenesis factor C [Pellia epiphylla]